MHFLDHLIRHPWYSAIAIVGLASLCWLHVVLNELGISHGHLFDLVLSITTSIFKFGSIIALPLVLASVFESIAKNRRMSAIAFVIWSITAVALIVGMAATRNSWAPILSSSTSHYYHLGSSLLNAPANIVEHRDLWGDAWMRGEVQRGEIGLAMGLILINVLIGYRFGLNPIKAVVIAYVGSLTLLLVYVSTVGLFLADYDFFHGDIYSGAIMFDSLLFFLEAPPYTSISSIFYVAALGSAMVICTLAKRSGSARPKRSFLSGTL